MTTVSLIKLPAAVWPQRAKKKRQSGSDVNRRSVFNTDLDEGNGIIDAEFAEIADSMEPVVFEAKRDWYSFFPWFLFKGVNVSYYA
ncbi:MAG: hypothetical protein HQM16_07500 [Deltaproteobacteria bacterium]|nr:hypothetical protein [Deltaproteobacteria bacterium]